MPGKPPGTAPGTGNRARKLGCPVGVAAMSWERPPGGQGKGGGGGGGGGWDAAPELGPVAGNVGAPP